MIPPGDPRHGTPGAYRNGCHCTVCRSAHSRRCKQYRVRAIAGGGSTLVDASETAELLASARARMSASAVAKYLGTSHAWVSAVIEGRISRVDPARAAAARTLPGYWPTDTSHVSAVGARRRLQALHALGYTWIRLAQECGYSVTGLKSMVHGRWDVIEAATDTAIRSAFDRLSMVIPVGSTRHEKGAITSARKQSGKYGWAPPLAWDDIDDPDGQPNAWEYSPPTRREVLLELDSQGVGVSGACACLGLSRGSLQKWCANNGLSEVFRRLGAREVRSANQYDSLSKEVA